jgi:hypothetical protein
MASSETKLKDVICEVLKTQGIDVKGELKVCFRFFGEGYGVITVESYDKFVELFGDGIFFFECHDTTIRNVDDRGPISIAFVLIESEYKDSKWTTKLFADEEEIWVSDIGLLEKRRQRIIKAITDGLSLLTFVIKLHRDDTKSH